MRIRVYLNTHFLNYLLSICFRYLSKNHRRITACRGQHNAGLCLKRDSKTRRRERQIENARKRALLRSNADFAVIA